MAKLSQIHSGEMLRSASGKGFSHIDDNQVWFSDSPLLSKEGQPRSGGVVCSKMRSHLIDTREALHINRYFRLNRPPQPRYARHPRLTKAGNGSLQKHSNTCDF